MEGPHDITKETNLPKETEERCFKSDKLTKPPMFSLSVLCCFLHGRKEWLGEGILKVHFGFYYPLLILLIKLFLYLLGFEPVLP